MPKAPKVTLGLPLVQLRLKKDNTYSAGAKTLWDELCRFDKMLRTDPKIDRKSPRIARIVGAVGTLMALLECQHPQTPALSLPAAPSPAAPRRNRKK